MKLTSEVTILTFGNRLPCYTVSIESAEALCSLAFSRLFVTTGDLCRSSVKHSKRLDAIISVHD